MAKDTRFWSLMAKTKPRPELDGQKYIFFLVLKGLFKADEVTVNSIFMSVNHRRLSV